MEEGILPARLTKEYLQGCFDAGGILLEAPDGEQQPEEEPAPRTPTSRTRTSRSPVPERRAKRECVMARGFDKFVQERLKIRIQIKVRGQAQNNQAEEEDIPESCETIAGFSVEGLDRRKQAELL